MATNDSPAVGLLPRHSEQVTASANAVETATILSIAEDGTPTVKLAADPHVALARYAVKTTRAEVETAIETRQPVVLVFEGGDRTRPLIIGFIEPLEAEPPRAGEQISDASGRPAIEADVDGRRVKVTAEEEIVLQCGSASLTLRRNGRVIIRGTYLESHSDGTNRIKGGQILLN